MDSGEEFLKDRLRGVLVGTAVGDSIGLPAEGLSRKTIEKLGWNSNWKQRLFFGKGMLSDDTEHTLFVAQSLLAHGNDPIRFQHSLAWKLRLWLLGAPAGIGLATLRAIIRLWFGSSPEKSGVFSAGNGPAMRSAVIGAFFADDKKDLLEFTRRSTEITHCNRKAYVGAVAVSYAASWALKHSMENVADKEEFLSVMRGLTGEDEWRSIVDVMKSAFTENESVCSFASRIGLRKGVSGYIYHTVPVAIYSWIVNYGNFEKTLSDVLDCGGDTDTVGAIAGALAGSAVGESGIPDAWKRGLLEYPRGRCFILKVADALAEKKTGAACGPVAYFWPALFLRNLFFTVVVLWHGFLRLVPAPLRKFIIF